MLRMISDEIRFPEELASGRVARRVYSTYPYRVYQAMVSLQGIDYGFSDQEGFFFRSQIQVASQILSPYEVQVEVTFGFRSRDFDKRTDATIRYALLIEQF